MKSRILAALIVALILATASISGAATCTVPNNGVVDPTTSSCSPRAVCNGTTDDGPVLVAAMTAIHNNSGGTLLLPNKNCLSNSTLSITSNNVSITCAGGGTGCSLTTTSSTIPQIIVEAPVYYTTIKGIALWRQTQTSQPGADGINFSAWSRWSKIEDVLVYGGYNGVVLNSSRESIVHNLTVVAATQDGLQLKPDTYDPDAGTIDWALDNINILYSQRYGIRLMDNPGIHTNINMTPWNRIYTEKNLQGSVFVSTTASTINNLSINNSRFRGDERTSVSDQVYISTNNGIGNAIHNTTVELAIGGSGIVIGADNDGFTITGTKVYASTYAGIKSYAPRLTLTGCETYANSGQGVRISAGSAVISGLTSNNNSQYGLLTDIDKVYVSGGDISGNGAGTFYSTVPLTNSKLCAVNGVSGYCK